MAFTFPSSPVKNQIYVYGASQWRYDGTNWVSVDHIGTTPSIKEFGAVGDGVVDDTAALVNALSYIGSSTVKSLHIPASMTIVITSDVTIPDGVTVSGGGTIQAGTSTNTIHRYLFIGDSSKITGLTIKNITILSYYNKNNWEISNNTFGAVLNVNPLLNEPLGTSQWSGSYEAIRVTNFSSGTDYSTATKQPTCPTGFRVVNNKSGADGYSSFPIALIDVQAGTNADITDNKFYSIQQLTDATIKNSDGTTTNGDPEIQFAGLTLNSSSIINTHDTSIYDMDQRGVGVVWNTTWAQAKATAGYSWTGMVIINSTNKCYRVTGKVTSLGTLGSAISSTSSLGTITVSDSTHLVSTGGYILIDNEQIAYSSSSGSTINLAIRGINFTTAATHSSGANVYLVQLSNGGTGSLGTFEPTHTSGTQINGELLLTYDGDYATSAPYNYKLCDIAAGSGGPAGGFGLVGVGVGIPINIPDMQIGRYYRIISLGSFANIAANQANWNIAGGTTGKKYSVGSVFLATNNNNFDPSAIICPVYFYDTATKLKVKPDVGGIAVNSGKHLRIKNNIYHGGRVSMAFHPNLAVTAPYYFPITDNVIENNTFAYSNQETLSFDAIASENGAPFLTTTIGAPVVGTLQTPINGYLETISVTNIGAFPYSGTIQIGTDVVNYYRINDAKLSLSATFANSHSVGENVILLTQGGWNSQITLTDDASPVINNTGILCSPVGRILKFHSGALAGKAFTITAVNGAVVTLGDDWGNQFHVDQSVATSGDIVSIESDIRRNKVINNTIIEGTITLWGIGSDSQISHNTLTGSKYGSYPYTGSGIDITSMFTYAVKNSTLLGGHYCYLAPSNLIVSDNIVSGSIAFYSINDFGTSEASAQMRNVTLVNNKGSYCMLGPLTDFLQYGNNFARYSTANNPSSGSTVSTVQMKITPEKKSISVKEFGAFGDGINDDTSAIQAWVDYCSSSSTPANVMEAYAPAGKYLISSTIYFKKNICNIKGDGPENTVFLAQFRGSNIGTSIFKAYDPVGNAAPTDFRSNWRDFGIVDSDMSYSSGSGYSGGNTGKGIDLSLSGAYDSTFENIYIQSKGNSFDCSIGAFSTKFNSIRAASTSGHSFVVYGSNTNEWNNCYAVQCGSNKAGYRLTGSINLENCNGLNHGDYWGVFGSDISGSDGFQGDFPISTYPEIILTNCNIEAFTKGGIRVETNWKIFNINGGKIDRAGLSSAYDSMIRLLAAPNVTGMDGSYMTPVNLNVATVFKGSGVPNGGLSLTEAYLFAGGFAAFIDHSGAFATSAMNITKFYSTVISGYYPIIRTGGWFDGSDQVISYSGLKSRKMVSGIIKYDTPTAYTPVGTNQMIDVTGYTKVTVTPAAAASINKAIFTNSGYRVDEGRNGDLLIEAGNANLTIVHSASGTDTFRLTGSTNITMSTGQILRFCRSVTSSQWIQV